MRIKWGKLTSERYCVDSGSPVIREGDRCIRHGHLGEMCYTSTRNPRCKHERMSANHPYPRCSECGVTGFMTLE